MGRFTNLVLFFYGVIHRSRYCRMGRYFFRASDNCDGTFDICFLSSRRNEASVIHLPELALLVDIQHPPRVRFGIDNGMLQHDIAHHCDDTIRSSEAEGKIEEEINKLGILMDAEFCYHSTIISTLQGSEVSR